MAADRIFGLVMLITAVKYIGVDGGADAITQTVGGFTQAMTGDMSEVVSFLENGDIRVIAVLTKRDRDQNVGIHGIALL